MEKSSSEIAVADDPLSGVIRFEVDKVSSLDFDGRDSPEVEVGGVPWRLNVCKAVSHERRAHGLFAYLVGMTNHSRLWSIDVRAELTLLNADDAKKVVEPFGKHATYRHKESIWGEFVLDWKEVVDEEKGFAKNDKITVEIRFTILSMQGIRTTTLIDFNDPNEPFNDVALTINGENIYVSRQILSAHSPFFKAMFYGNFDEKGKREIELKELDREEFIELLNVVYPTGKIVTDDNVNVLLKLGDRFDMKNILDLSENHLISSSKLEFAAKLLLSDQYRLIKLQDHCLTQLKTVHDVKEVQKSAEYNQLSDATKVALLEKLC